MTASRSDVAFGLGLLALVAHLPGETSGRGSMQTPRVAALASSSEAVREFASTGSKPRMLTRPARRVNVRQERQAFSWPVQGEVMSRFGRRGLVGWHHGVDIRSRPGETIRAAAPGVVVFSGRQSSYGLVVKIAHANGFSTLYAHNVRNFVGVGDRVATGTPIAAVGRTGRATTPHLHFEIQRHGRYQNPLPLLARREPPPLLASSG